MTLINENIRNIVNEVPEHKNKNFIKNLFSKSDQVVKGTNYVVVKFRVFPLTNKCHLARELQK